MPVYWTVPYVAIKDWRLAAAYYAGAALLVISTFSSAVLQQRFLDQEPVIGQGKAKLRHLAGVGSPEYCQRDPGCAEWDFEEVAELHGASGATFIRTFIEDHHEASSCAKPHCATGFRLNSTESFFIARVEDFPLEVKSRVRATKWEQLHCKRGAFCPFAGTVKDFPGRLLGPGGEVLEEIPAGEAPVFPVGRWLQATGIDSLDAAHDKYSYGQHGAKEQKSYRRKGMELHIIVRWSNPGGFWEHLWGHRALSYDLRVDHVGSATTREVIQHVFDDASSLHRRTVRKSGGLSVVVDRDGAAGVFSLSLLLSQLGTFAALLGLLAAGLDVLWQYVLPFLGIDYNSAVFDFVEKDGDGLTVKRSSKRD